MGNGINVEVENDVISYDVESTTVASLCRKDCVESVGKCIRFQ